ncbi:hypothetical protein PAAG_12043 [Paracoccidioides lutzii Pb01]|uniref:Uncharacterized protein n=1 Tax=Paracoccidioides lutzii (strain ATCC MYA-826 / Pb01) TaxID=502779 RepID=A0A0A2V4J5_PARBA|nr:hypothetical protein PAAG_12043 [Paracoccidioides lutzii Pb01]KGQ01272.1 hypothetical protein PAAG_12043 [Paracoccidioides lutzii Pb01]
MATLPAEEPTWGWRRFPNEHEGGFGVALIFLARSLISPLTVGVEVNKGSKEPPDSISTSTLTTKELATTSLHFHFHRVTNSCGAVVQFDTPKELKPIIQACHRWNEALSKANRQEQ